MGATTGLVLPTSLDRFSRVSQLPQILVAKLTGLDSAMEASRHVSAITTPTQAHGTGGRDHDVYRQSE
jgi:hypothetical protein